MYTSCMKNAMHLIASLSLGKYCFLPLFANVIKNKITSTKTNIFVFCIPVEDRIVNE